MDQSLWQTPESIDIIHSSHMWIQTILSCRKHCQTMQIGTVSRLRFCRRSWGIKIHFWRNIVRFWKSCICPISWMCKEQTSVSHSSTESEIISLDAGLRLDRIPALDLWDLIVTVLHGNTHQNDHVWWDPYKSPTWKKIHGKIDDLDNVDFISSNVHSSHQEALLYVFEGNEAVIKMIIKGRSPTMRHVSRTHRVALDWLFDRINLDPKILIKYIDTKNQLADILTTGNFTHYEWTHLLCLFNSSHFSPINSVKAKSKRTQEDAGEEKSHSNIKADDVFGVKMPCKGSDRTCLDCIWKSWENQTWKSISSEFVRCAANKYGETRIGR